MMESLIAGATAGLLVDLSLYPIDTVKTRIQSKEGFLAAGGFKGVYKGLSAVAIGSVPGGATFFLTYDGVKKTLFNRFGLRIGENATVDFNGTAFTCQAAAAMCGESAACLIRVPVEMVKQNMQVGNHSSVLSALRSITNGGDTGAQAVRVRALNRLFTGMPIMLLRELPFSVIQMSLYELLKYRARGNEALQPYYYVLLPFCGAVSGGCAAFATTPLDVVKTRIMLEKRQVGASSISSVVRDIVAEPPRPGDRFGMCQKFFRGAGTRVVWISLGGSIFFGTYEFVKKTMGAANS